MIIQYFTFSISITFISWIVGMIVNVLLRNLEFYKKISNLNFIKNETINRRIGLGIFKWVVTNTFFKYFNQKLKLKNKIEITDLNALSSEMTFSEISHLIGFAFVNIFILMKLINGNFLFALIFMTVNILMNLYPSLLQQENKRRIDLLKKRFKQL